MARKNITDDEEDEEMEIDEESDDEEEAEKNPKKKSKKKDKGQPQAFLFPRAVPIPTMFNTICDKIDDLAGLISQLIPKGKKK